MWDDLVNSVKNDQMKWVKMNGDDPQKEWIWVRWITCCKKMRERDEREQVQPNADKWRQCHDQGESGWAGERAGERVREKIMMKMMVWNEFIRLTCWMTTKHGIHQILDHQILDPDDEGSSTSFRLRQGIPKMSADGFHILKEEAPSRHHKGKQVH